MRHKLFTLDFGANIGMYSLMVAAMGREVISVDAVYQNLAHIAKSHSLTQLGNIVILYNSIRCY